MKILIGQFIFVAYGSSKPTIWEKYDNKEFKDTEKGRGAGGGRACNFDAFRFFKILNTCSS